jgi:hypothetical protein
VGLIEVARRAALGYAGEESLALLGLFLAHGLPGRLVAALIVVGLAVSCTAAWFAVRQSRNLGGVRG